MNDMNQLHPRINLICSLIDDVEGGEILGRYYGTNCSFGVMSFWTVWMQQQGSCITVPSIRLCCYSLTTRLFGWEDIKTVISTVFADLNNNCPLTAAADSRSPKILRRCQNVGSFDRAPVPLACFSWRHSRRPDVPCAIMMSQVERYKSLRCAMHSCLLLHQH